MFSEDSAFSEEEARFLFELNGSSGPLHFIDEKSEASVRQATLPKALISLQARSRSQGPGSDSMAFLLQHWAIWVLLCYPFHLA